MYTQSPPSLSPSLSLPLSLSMSLSISLSLSLSIPPSLFLYPPSLSLLISFLFFQILLFDFCSEVYVWMGKRCPQSYRKPSMIKARKIYDSGHIPPVFSNSSTPKKTTQSPSRQSRVHSKLVTNIILTNI